VDLDGVALDGEGERRGRGRSSMGGGVERGGHPPQHRIRATPAWVAAATGGDRRLCTLRLERGDRVVTGSVVSGMGAMTGPRN
jgi:hypothetical protein